LELPWVSEKLPSYVRMFGFTGKLGVAQLRDDDVKSMPQVPSVNRSTAKLILSKPSLRPEPSERTAGKGSKLFVNLVYQGD
jgi:hypothetical protein